MKCMSRFFYSLALVLTGLAAFAQGQQTDTVAPAQTERYGIRVGIDLHSLSRSFYDENFSGIEVVADYRYSKKIYIASEVGFLDEYTVNDDQLNFTTSGAYIKAGFDYNVYENWLDMENMIYVGVRYGGATFSQTLNSYKIYDSSGYFDEVTIYPDRKYPELKAHWAEILGGVKAELLNNLFLGFTVRLNVLISDKKPQNFDNLYIPGFNRTYEGSFGVGFNYTLSYHLPLYKKKK